MGHAAIWEEDAPGLLRATPHMQLGMQKMYPFLEARMRQPLTSLASVGPCLWDQRSL